jgi:hypothetical protein
MMSRAPSLAQAVPDAPGVPDGHAAPAARPAPATRPGRDPAPATRPGRDPAPAAALHGAGLAALRLAGATRAQVLRLVGTEAGLAAALGAGLAAVVTAVTVAAVRRGVAGVAPSAGAVPWVPLAAIGLVCLVVAVLGSVLTAAAALRDPGQTLTARLPGPVLRTTSTTGHIGRGHADLPARRGCQRALCPARGAWCAGKVGGFAPGRGRGRPAQPRPGGSLRLCCEFRIIP